MDARSVAYVALVHRFAAAASALSGASCEEDLEVGVGRDDGSDIAALGDPIASREQFALLGD